jgi:hypothetical protein
MVLVSLLGVLLTEGFGTRLSDCVIQDRILTRNQLPVTYDDALVPRPGLELATRNLRNGPSRGSSALPTCLT